MKDFDAKSKEWWEVTEECFFKELEKNMAQHRTDEKMYIYKVEVFQRTFIDFVCESPTNTKASGQDEE